MSEEEKKEIPIAYRIISIIALFVGIATFLCKLSIYPFVVYDNIDPTGISSEEIRRLLSTLALYSFLWFWPIAIIGLILSIVTLFIERNKYFRLMPLIFVLAGMLLFSADYVDFFVF